MNAIIFGSNGQDAHYLREILFNHKIEVINCARDNSDHNGDVSEFKYVKEIINKIKPNYIFHFAANSTTNHNALFDNHNAISTGTLNILEASKIFSHNSKIFLSGSAMQFENKNFPIKHTDDFNPSSPYSVSRIHSVMNARYYRNSFNLKVYIGYLFNHDSELRTERHINQKIVKTVKRIKSGSTEQLRIGSLSVEKEFNHASDIVNGIWTLINQDNIFECCIGSGKSYKIKDWVELCFNYFNLNWKEYVVKDEDFNPEYSTLVSDSKIIRSLGWAPKISIEEQVEKMMSAK